jgi:acyl carrier protein phosphodiesterase
MNYLAHTALARPNHFSLVGNLLGDFCKGVQLDILPSAVLAGLANHRAVDAFTDRHPVVVQAKTCFSPQRRRFAGVALDILFDHFLIRHWHRFYSQPYSDYKQQLYTDLALAQSLMPEQMASTMYRVRTDDWLSHYQQLPQLGHVMDRIAGRIRFYNQFAGIIDEINPLYLQLEHDFLHFYPQLQQHIMQLKLER